MLVLLDLNCIVFNEVLLRRVFVERSDGVVGGIFLGWILFVYGDILGRFYVMLWWGYFCLFFKEDFGEWVYIFG